jgi:hypothetical protein
MSYLSHITRVLAAHQATNLRPVHERRIRQAVISEYFEGDGNIFSDGEFSRALFDGVESGRFVKVRDSYLLVNEHNEVYDPHKYEKWLDDQGFEGRQRQAMWIDYDNQFGLYDD